MRKISIGIQSFADLRSFRGFYVDKTEFIREWYENLDVVTLITRPRRFGKTLMLDMVNCFFSNQYAGRKDLFEGLDVSRYPDLMEIQGTIPSVLVSFASVKAQSFEDFLTEMHLIFANILKKFRFLLQDDALSTDEKELFTYIANPNLICPDKDNRLEYKRYIVAIENSLFNLSSWLYAYFPDHKKVFLFIDEYDTPIQAAYLNGFYDEAISVMRELLGMSCKYNEYLGRALITGITRIAKESLFSDLNNLKECSVMDSTYARYFGFMEGEQEMLPILREYHLESRTAEVREWYEGYTVGNVTGIYNPWSVTGFLDDGEHRLKDYWNRSGGTAVIDSLVRRAPGVFQVDFQELLQNKSIKVTVPEDLVFPQLGKRQDAIWSLLLHTGYIKPVTDQDGMKRFTIVNHEVRMCLLSMVENWFADEEDGMNYMTAFRDALLDQNLAGINAALSGIVEICVSGLDSGTKPARRGTQPEKYFHGMMTGLVACLLGRFDVTSNGESGFGRFDLQLEPVDRDKDPTAFIIEFKVFDKDKGDRTIRDTAERARKQIDEKQYETKLMAKGFKEKSIRKYGFGFRGKKVLVVE